MTTHPGAPAAAADVLPVPTWLALHLFVLGAATNAVMVWSRHFAQALLHARDVPPGAGGFAEPVVPEPGTYPMVTHRLADAARGASGLLVADPA